MTEKYFKYSVDGRKYDVPESRVSEFEKVYPTSTIDMDVDGRKYDVPPSRKEEFLSVYPNALYAFDMTKEEPKEEVSNDEMATSVINSYKNNRTATSDYISKVDEEYKAKNANKPEKTGWQKFGDVIREAGAAQRLGPQAVVLEQKVSDISKGQDYVDAKIAKNIYDSVDDKVNQYLDPAKTFVGGVAQGIADSVSKIETWDSTVGAEKALRVYEITKKLDKGENLTEGEQMIVNALVDDLTSDIYLASGFGRGYKAGKVTGESLPFMIETFTNPASGFGEAVSKKFGKEIFKKVAKKAGTAAAKAAVAGTRVAADVAGAAAMAATSSSVKVAEDALNRISGQVDFTVNEDGTLKFNGFVGGEDSALGATMKAFSANTIDHFSEMVGNYFAPVGKMTKNGAIALADKVGAKRVATLLNEMTPSGFGAAMNDFFEQTQIQGLFGEAGEEMVGGALNAIIVGDQSLKKYDKDGNINPNYLFSMDNMIDTFLGVSIIGGISSGARIVGYTTPENRFNREISRAKKSLDGKLSEEDIAQLEAFTANPLGVDSANLVPLFEGKDKDVKEAIGKYLSAVMQKEGYNIARTANISGTQQGMNEMKNAYQLGQNLSEADLYDAEEAEARALQGLSDSGLIDRLGELNYYYTPDELINLSSYDLFSLSQRQDINLTKDEREAVKTLALVRNAKEGLNNKLNSLVRAEVKASEAVANMAAENGVITVGYYNGEKVYVRGGVKVSNGSIVRPEGVSGYPVEIISSMNGEATTVDAGDVTGVASGDVAGYNEMMANIISTSYQQRFDAWRQKKSVKSKLSEIEQFVGQKVFINTPDGKMAEVEVQQILPNGEVLIKGKKGDLGGQSNLRIDVDSFYDSMSRDTDGNPIFNQAQFRSQTEGINAAQSRLYAQQPTVEAPVAEPVEVETPEATPEAPEEPLDFREGEHTILINGVPVSVEVQNQDDVADAVTYVYTDENGKRKVGRTTVAGFADAVEQAQDYQTEEPISEVSVEEVSEEPVANVPAPEDNIELTAEDINWDALFEQDTEAYFAELQKQFGEGAADVINMEITATQKELDKLEKNQGATRTERVKNLGKIAKLRLEKGILEDMANRLQRKNEPISETVEVIETEQVVTPEVAATESITGPIDNSAEIEIPEPRQIPLDKKNSEPRNGVELAANELGKKQGIKLLWDSVQRHTGYGDGEKKKFFGLFRTKEKGGMDLETAGERLMEIDREYGFNFFDQNDPNAGMNAILEALGANNTVGDLRSYTARMRQAEAQEYENAAYKEAMERFYEERGESYDDYKAYNEQVRDELKSGYALSDEQLNEYNATLAEEYDRYDRERNATESEQGEDGPVRTTEDIGDLPLAEGEAYGGSEGSNQVLRETQTVQQGGSENSEGGRLGVGVSSQDVDRPILRTEETGESISTLDEDMPDFTTEAPKAPVAPKSVDNPISEAQKREESLIQQLSREEIPFKQRQDLAYNAGKAVADLFATREEYEAYEEVAADLGEFIEDFDRGVEASFANRNQYHIGEVITESEVSEEAIDLVNELIDSSLEGVVDVERASDEQTKEVLALGGIENQFSVETDKPIFISNAALAVQGIKMEKATPEQWLKMIEKAGGLKAGEDKWMGLSDWLKASDKKTLTKQEVLDFVTANTIQIEDVHYSANAEENAQNTMSEIERRLKEKFDGYISEYYEEHDIDDIYGSDATNYAIEKLREEMSDTTFPYTIENDGSNVWVVFTYEEVDELQDWANRLGIEFTPENPANETRLNYTSDGLENKKEIAIVVPTVESWNEYDEIHFGDAGDGRAVAWVRFGDAKKLVSTTEAIVVEEFEKPFKNYRGWDVYKPLGRKDDHMYISAGTLKDGRFVYAVYVKDAPIGAYESFDEAKEALNKYLAENPSKRFVNKKVLVIDEIQSKRHQEGREKGYKSDFDRTEQRNKLIEEYVAAQKRRAELVKEHMELSDAENVRLATIDIELDKVTNIPEYDRLTSERDEIIKNQENRSSEIHALRSTEFELKWKIEQMSGQSEEYFRAIPDAPFDKNWHELAMKRMLRYAAENGYDAIAWTKGEQQAKRYNIGDVVSEISVKHAGSSGYEVESFNGSGYSVLYGVYPDVSAIAEVYGKELAERITNSVSSYGDKATIDGENLSIGGEGMKGFYDKMLPAFMNKYGKKWGVKAEEIKLNGLEDGEVYMHSVPVNEAMKASVMEGQPMFFKTPNGIVYGWTDGKKIYLTKAGINPNTKIHEYTHLWAKAMMQKNPKGWNSIKQLLKNTPVWNEVMNDANYSNIHGNEDMVASEVISRLSGTKNAAKLEQMAQKMIDDAKGKMRKAEARGLIQNIKDALNKFWSWVGKNLFEIENFNSIDEITDRVLYDLVNKTDLGELSEGKSEFSKKSYGKEKPYGQKVRYTPAFLDDIYFRVLSKYHFGKDSSPYVYMDGYIMRLDVPDSEHLKYYRNVEKTDGFGVRFDIFVGNITEEEFNALIEDYERGIPRTKEALSELFEAYRKNRGSELSSDNVHIENIESDTSDGRLYGQASERKDERRTSVSRSNSYLRASEIDSDIFPISRVNLLPKTSTSTKLDTEYFDAIEKGKKVRAENIIEDAANSAGYTEAVYHGTPSYGFTEFESKRKSGAIFTTTARNTAANYGGDGKYASVRKINKGIKEVKSAQDVLDNATSVLDQNWRLATHQERSEVIARVEADAKKVSDKIQELKADLSNTPFELQEAIAWMENIIYDAAEGRENGNEGNSLSSMLIDGYKKFKESREFARQYIQEHYNELTPEQWRYWSYINGFEVGDVAIDAGYSMARAVSENEVATVDGKSFVFIEDLNEQTQKDKNVGTYKLYGNLGNNPLVIDAEKKVWFDLDFNGMKTTDSIAEWAKENGYTSVVFKNIYDYGDLSDVKVFFNPSQLKSADAITYDNDGNIIPPSERFNVDKNDIRYRKADSQNAAVDYLAGDARLAAIQNAVSEEAKKLNVSVTYKTRAEMPKGHQNDKGYYNPQTGEIVICTENATSIADAIKTILHEAVAHKGLRKLFGNRFDEFIRNVYDMLDAETKAKVDARAAANYNGDTAVAMEEYMASLAENENFADQTIWEKIKSIFTNLINDILGRNDIKIRDNELRYILRASYNNMVNPRSMDTIEGWAKDQLMREEYKVNESTPEILSRTGVDPTEVAATSARQIYDRVVSDSWNEFQRQFQDAFQPVRVAIEAIQAETGGIPIEDYENYLLIQNQSSSRSRVEIDNFERRYYSPVIEQVQNIVTKILESRGLDIEKESNRAQVYEEVVQYLIAKHGVERNKYYQTHKTRKMTAKEMKPLLEQAKSNYEYDVNFINLNANLSEAERDLRLREALDIYNASVTEIKNREVPDMRDYAGLTALFNLDAKEYEKAEEMAQNKVDEFEALVDTDALWKKINAATDKTLRHSYESGLLSRQQYNDIKAMFKFYIPLRGFDETTAEDVYSYARFEGNRFNPAVKTAEGRTSLADDPIAIIMNMAESEIAQGNKNRAKQALYNYLLNRAGATGEQNSLMQIEDVWYTITTDETGNTVEQIAVPDHEHGETYDAFENRMQSLAEEGKAAKSKKGKLDVGMRFQKQTNRNAHYVYLKINGVEKAIYINGDPKAAEAINGKYSNQLGEGAKKIRDVQRIISSTFTNYSLEFTARNYLRDMIYSHINIDVRESDPAYRKKFRQNWRHNNMPSMMNMLKAYRAGELETRALTDDEAAFVEFMNNGGQTGYTLINSVENHKKDLQKAIERMRTGIENGGVKDSSIFKATLGGIELLNEASELVTRFAAFKTSRDMGRSIVTSISDAKEITVNFNTKGAQDGTGWMGMVAQYFGWSKYFFNASVQGVQNIKSMADANKLKFCKTVGGVIAAGFFTPILVSVIAGLIGGEDDEEIYWNIPEYDRQNNFCIPVGGGLYAKIPLPIGFREVYALGDMVAAMLMDKKFTRDFGQVGMDMANKVASVVLPINPLESASTGLNIWQTVLYTALPSSTQFLIQNYGNVDWKGAPIQKEYTYNENDPQWMKAFASNPDWMTGLSKWCNEHINLDGDYKGLDWSPEKFDNTLSNLFGGIYTLVKKSGNSISMIWNEENRTLYNVPMAGIIVGSGISKDDRFVTDAFYEMQDYYDANVNYIKRRAEKFGLTLDDVFLKEKGKHHPKMMEIYQNLNFNFMQEWYLGNDELDEITKEIKKVQKQIAEKGHPSAVLLNKLAKLENKLEADRRDFVNDMLELD